LDIVNDGGKNGQVETTVEISNNGKNGDRKQQG